MQGTTLNESVLSLLDYWWYAQSVLDHCPASRVPSVKSSGTSAVEGSEAVMRPSVANIPSGTAYSAIDETEIRRVFDRFDDNRDGFISGEELRRYMMCCGNNLSNAEAKSMISCVDRNHDGGVDFDEFLSLYQTHCSGDTTGEDDKRARKDEEGALLGAFCVFDRNHDGFISAQELQTVLLNLGMPEGKSLLTCKKIIRNVDRDGDGLCNVREFLEMMSGHSF